MCIPQPATAAAPANQVPSMQAADNLVLGGQNDPRGAATLGRLQLRLLGNPGATTAPGTTGVAATAATPAIAKTTAAASTSNQTGVGPQGAGSANPVPNASLRFGQGAGNRP